MRAQLEHPRPKPTLRFAPQHFAALPRDRQARVAARRVFVDLKLRFMQAAAQVDGERGEWLQRELRRAEQPTDLLRLRGHVFAALAGDDVSRRQTRHWLRRSLDTLMPESVPSSGFASF